MAARNSISPRSAIFPGFGSVWEDWVSRLWRPHPFWLPLAPAYRAGFRAHQAWLRRQGAALGPPPGLPLVVIGSLRAGGSGKTSVASALARDLARRGLRPALLAYRIGPGSGGPGGDPLEVGPDSDWRSSSEEAVLLARETGARVFATRDRARAWRTLADMGRRRTFDILLSDDGFQDPRLHGAFRILLRRPGERAGSRDSLPAGPFREGESAAARADIEVSGPWPRAGEGVTGTLPEGGPGGGRRFRRRLILPPGWDAPRPCLAHCALGDPAPFLADLARAGIRPAETVRGRNHGAPPWARLRAASARHPGLPILCTRKDWVKLAGSDLPFVPVDQEIELDAALADRVAGLVRSEPYLVDYPRC